jgi:hypothetical protein
VTGTEASVDMFTSSSGHRGLYHHMILPINIPIVMPMHTSGLVTEIIEEIYVVLISFGFAILTKRVNR